MDLTATKQRKHNMNKMSTQEQGCVREKNIANGETVDERRHDGD
jgi:hypothetical protein